MGVPGLWSHLSAAGTSHNLETLDLDALVATVEPGTSQRLPIIGVDLSAWLFHARLSVEGSNPILRLIFFRLARLLSLPIHAVFVFDGPLRPRVKRGRTVGAKKHPLTGPLMEMIATFGAIGWEAPGEAEAELARMNQEGLIDAVLSDDVDSLIFGALTVMRNWSPTLSQARPATAEDGGDNLATVYRASNIRELPDLLLDRDGLILVALMAGGDYDVRGLGGCGVKTAIGLAQAGHGQTLLNGFRKHCKIDGHDVETKLPSVTTSSLWSPFLKQWLSEVRDELTTNKQGFLNGRSPKLAQSDAFKCFLGTQEALEVLGSYISPVTTWTLAEAAGTATTQTGRRKLKFKDPDLPAMASFAQRTFAWGPKATIIRLRNVVWKGLLLQELRRDGVVRASNAEGGKTSYEGEDLAALSSSNVSHLEVSQIHGERRHVGTGQLLEYRLEWHPQPLARSAEEGIDPLLNVGPGYDEDYPSDIPTPSQCSSAQSTDAEDGEEELPPCSPYGLTLAAPDGHPPSPTKKRRRAPVDPYSSMRTWILADRLASNSVGKALIDEYHQRLKLKEKTKVTKKSAASKAKPAAKKKNSPDSSHLRIDSIFTSRKGPAPTSLKPLPKHIDETSIPSDILEPDTPRSFASQDATPLARPTSSAIGSSFGEPFTTRTFGRTQSGPAAFNQPSRGDDGKGNTLGVLADERSDEDDDDDDTFVLYSEDDVANVTLTIPRCSTVANQKLVSSSRAQPSSTSTRCRNAKSKVATVHLLSSPDIDDDGLGLGAEKEKEEEQENVEEDPDASLPDAIEFLRSLGQRKSKDKGPSQRGGEDSPSPRRLNVKRTKRGIGLREGSPPPPPPNGGGGGDGAKRATRRVKVSVATTTTSVGTRKVLLNCNNAPPPTTTIISSSTTRPNENCKDDDVDDEDEDDDQGFTILPSGGLQKEMKSHHDASHSTRFTSSTILSGMNNNSRGKGSCTSRVVRPVRMRRGGGRKSDAIVLSDSDGDDEGEGKVPRRSGGIYTL